MVIGYLLTKGPVESSAGFLKAVSWPVMFQLVIFLMVSVRVAGLPVRSRVENELGRSFGWWLVKLYIRYQLVLLLLPRFYHVTWDGSGVAVDKGQKRGLI